MNCFENYVQTLHKIPSFTETDPIYVTNTGEITCNRNERGSLLDFAGRIHAVVGTHISELSQQEISSLQTWLRTKKSHLEAKISSSIWEKFLNFFHITSDAKKALNELDETISLLRNARAPEETEAPHQMVPPSRPSHRPLRENEEVIIFSGVPMIVSGSESFRRSVFKEPTLETPVSLPQKREPRRQVQQPQEAPSPLEEEISDSLSSSSTASLDSLPSQTAHEEEHLPLPQKPESLDTFLEKQNRSDNLDLLEEGGYFALSFEDEEELHDFQSRIEFLLHEMESKENPIGKGLSPVEEKKKRAFQIGNFNMKILHFIYQYICQGDKEKWSALDKRYHLGFNPDWLEEGTKEMLFINTIAIGKQSYRQDTIFQGMARCDENNPIKPFPAHVFKEICAEEYRKAKELKEAHQEKKATERERERKREEESVTCQVELV